MLQQYGAIIDSLKEMSNCSKELAMCASSLHHRFQNGATIMITYLLTIMCLSMAQATVSVTEAAQKAEEQ